MTELNWTRLMWSYSGNADGNCGGYLDTWPLQYRSTPPGGLLAVVAQSQVWEFYKIPEPLYKLFSLQTQGKFWKGNFYEYKIKISFPYTSVYLFSLNMAFLLRFHPQLWSLADWSYYPGQMHHSLLSLDPHLVIHFLYSISDHEGGIRILFGFQGA